MRRLGVLIVIAASWAGSLSAQPVQPDGPVRVTLRAVEGLRYDVPRFAVPAGAAVELTLINADQMLHNLIVAAPGMRLEVVNAATAMGPAGLEKQFVPESPAVLASTRLLGPGEEQTITFTTPNEPGVYPYVCTFPGHGFLMYGAMYVGTAMPPEGDDPNIPPAEIADPSGDEATYPPYRPFVQRILLPDASPAAIAVALADGVNYCWDAGPCRLRYVWTGDFIDPYSHWRGAGDGFAMIRGEVAMRTGKPPVELAATIGPADQPQRVFAHGATADPNFPLRIGSSERAPIVAFHGYRITEDGSPEFHYAVDGMEVHEHISTQGMPGDARLVQRFRASGLDRAIWFVRHDDLNDAAATSSVGSFTDRSLRLSAEQGREFTITYQLPSPKPSTDAP